MATVHGSCWDQRQAMANGNTSNSNILVYGLYDLASVFIASVSRIGKVLFIRE